MASMTATAGLLAGMVAAALAWPAGAAMYRCGNVFQDRPCDDAATQQTIKPGKGAGKPVPRPPEPAAVPASLRDAPSAPATAASQPPAQQPVAARPAGAASAVRPGAPAVCAGVLEQAAAIDARLAGASNANTVEMLNRQRRAVEKSWSEAGC